MKIVLLPILFIGLNVIVWGQNSDSVPDFEDNLPLRKLRCGLWINGTGDIAIKEECVDPASFRLFATDSCGFITEPSEPIEIKMQDCYITHTYNLQDSLNNADNDYRSELKNVADTATFEILGKHYCKDKNNIYNLRAMAYGSVMFAHPYDKRFRVSEVNALYAFSSNECYYAGWYLPDADPETFEIIPVDNYALSRDKHHFYRDWGKMSDAEICAMERELSIELFAPKDLRIYVDSLLYVKAVPYIKNCTDPVFWRIVGKGKSIVPLLIDKLADTRALKEVYVPFFGGEYTVADVAYTALCEIISGIPTFELLGVELDEKGCGYCSYWSHLRAKKGNRKRFKKAVREWYHSHKNYLEWVEEQKTSNTGDCSKPVKSGSYKVKEIQEIQ